MVKSVLDYRFYLEELTKLGAYFQKNLQFYVFWEDKRICHRTRRQSSDIQWIIDISTGLGS